VGGGSGDMWRTPEGGPRFRSAGDSVGGVAMAGRIGEGKGG
jgi:hypothetical protein